MFCTSCGKDIQPDQAFCTNCGAAAGAAMGEQTTQPTKLAAQQPDQPTEPTEVPPQRAATTPPSVQARPAEPAQPPGTPKPPRRYGLMALVAGLIFVVCAVAAVVAYVLVKDDGNASDDASTAGGATTTVAGTQGTTTPGGTLAPGGVVDLVDLTKRASDMEASSVLEAQGSVDYKVDNLIDQKPATCWAEGVPGYGVGEHVDFTWSSPVTVYQVRIVPGYDKEAAGWDRWTSNGRVRTFDLVFSDGATESFAVTDSRATQSLDLSATHTVTSVRFVITGVYEAVPGPHKAEDTSVSEFHLWGTE